MDFFEDTYDFIRDNRELYYRIYQLLENNPSLSLEEIISLLRKDGLDCQENKVLQIIYFLMTREQCIVRDDYWRQVPKYKMLNPCYFESCLQNAYFSLEDNHNDKTFLLISDVHIGSNIFNAKLLENLYNYAISNGATRTFLLGDLFNGLKNCKNDEERENEFIRQINLFKEQYPSLLPSQMITYSNLGNHDESMNDFMKRRDFLTRFDLRNLTVYNPSFYVVQNNPLGNHGFSLSINHRNFHFNHKLFISPVIEDKKIWEIDDIKSEMLIDNFYDVLISGHLHKGLIYSLNDESLGKEKIYLGVPSSSNINVGESNAISYLVFMHENCMEVAILGCDENLKIYEINRLCWNFDKKNKSYCKVL